MSKKIYAILPCVLSVIFLLPIIIFKYLGAFFSIASATLLEWLSKLFDKAGYPQLVYDFIVLADRALR